MLTIETKVTKVRNWIKNNFNIIRDLRSKGLKEDWIICSVIMSACKVRKYESVMEVYNAYTGHIGGMK